MNAADRPAPKDAPGHWVCVECGQQKREHRVVIASQGIALMCSDGKVFR